MAASLRVLIVDDEPLARQRLAELLAEQPAVEIVGYATNGEGAIAEIEDLDPDLVFLDVQMPGKSGLDVVREIGPDAMPPTIFVTAFDQYALTAFDVAAVDYLVKPFDDERFEQAFRRARRVIELEQVGQLAAQLRTVLEQGGPGAPAPGPAPRPGGYLERVAVESRGQVRVVAVRAIDYITASGAYVLLHAGSERFVVRERLQTLEERLDPARFFRIHRSTIVQVDRIETLLRAGGGDYGVRLRGGIELKVSRSRFEALERRLGV
ncbi:MAG: response regulator transcription factor [Gemmatimonadetes bacterium]|nr:response regulator transcription factor [Gemmatimonadota bacterium]